VKEAQPGPWTGVLSPAIDETGAAWYNTKPGNRAEVLLRQSYHTDMYFEYKTASLPREACQHLDKYWRISRRFFEEGDFTLASFFAITLIEEVGKVIILGNRQISGKLDKKSFYNHQRKYAYAVGLTLLVNSRVTRIYGEEEAKFARWFREGELFRIRNKCLYLEIEGAAVRVPSESIAGNDAFLLVCIAGEVYAEIQGFYTGTGPDEWRAILGEVDAFRKANAKAPDSASEEIPLP